MAAPDFKDDSSSRKVKSGFWDDVTGRWAYVDSSVGLPVSDVSGSTIVNLYNINVVSVNVEYPLPLPANTKRIEFRCRDYVDIRFAFEAGRVAGPTAPYKTLKSGEVKSEWDLNFTSVTLYVASGTAGHVVEVEAYT